MDFFQAFFVSDTFHYSDLSEIKLTFKKIQVSISFYQVSQMHPSFLNFSWSYKTEFWEIIYYYNTFLSLKGIIDCIHTLLARHSYSKLHLENRENDTIKSKHYLSSANGKTYNSSASIN